MKNIKYMFKQLSNKYLLVSLLIVFVCPVLAVSYSNFIKTTNNYKSNEMMIGKLLYTMKINDTQTNQIVLSTRGTTYYDLEISNINEINSKYILAYKTNNEDVEIYIEKDSLNDRYGTINKDDTYTISIVVINPKNNTATLDFGIFGGYVANEYIEIEYEEGYEDPLDDTPWDVNVLAMTIDGVNATTLPATGVYEIDSYSCENDEVLEWDSAKRKLTTKNITGSPIVCNVNFKSIANYTKTFAQKIYEDNQKENMRNDFTSHYADNTNGKIFSVQTNTDNICKSTDTLTYVSGSGASSVCKTYFYAGDTENNYVLFGGHYWRIVRINEDQSVRLIYQGIENNFPTGSYNGYIVFSRYNDMNATTAASVQYYESTIYGLLMQWYRNNLSTNYDKYINKSTIFCNDKSIYSQNGNIITYSGYNRLVLNKNPNLKCSTSSDRLSSVTTTSNGITDYVNSNELLIFPIALITMDEAFYIGSVYFDTNWLITNNYFYDYASWASTYTITPYKFDNYGLLFRANTISNVSVTAQIGIRPVLSLKACTKYLTGNGTINDPYKVTIDSTCSSANN